MIVKKELLGLCAFAASAQVHDAVPGAIGALNTVKLKRPDRQKVLTTAGIWGLLPTDHKDWTETHLATAENLWVDLEEVIGRYSPDFTVLGEISLGAYGLRPDWDALGSQPYYEVERFSDDSKFPAAATKHGPRYAYNSTTLYRRRRYGKGYGWEKVWTTEPASEPDASSSAS